MSSPARIANQDVVNVFYDVATQFGMDGWVLIEKAGWQWLAVPQQARSEPFDQSRLQARPSGLTDDEWQALLEGISALLPSGPTRTYNVTNQQVLNVLYEVASQSGMDGWELVEKAGWEGLAVPDENRNAIFSTSRLQARPPGLTDDEWQAILGAIDRLLVAGDVSPSDIVESSVVQPSTVTPTRQIANQEVINVIFEVALQLGVDGWTLVERAGWQWLAVPPENREAVFDNDLLQTKPPGLADAEWELLSAAILARLVKPAKEEADWPDWWPWKRALVGLHGRGDGLNRDVDFQRFRSGRIESAKFLSRAGDEADRHVQEAHAARALSQSTSGPTPIILRLMFNFPRDRRISPQEFSNDVARHVQAFGAHQEGVLWLCEIHNEPNVFVEGFGGTWRSGYAFSDWWFEVRDLLRSMMPPDTKWGYPGLSPGGPSQFRGSGEKQFFNESQEAWKAADWVGAHSYWQTPQQMTDRTFGYSWKWIMERCDKPVAITEFANTSKSVSKKTKAQQYVDYYRKLRHVKGLLGAYSFVVSVSGQEWPEQKWDDEMAGIVGGRDF